MSTLLVDRIAQHIRTVDGGNRLSAHWAVLVDCTVNGAPGPHLLGSQGEKDARERLAWWQESRPDADPRLVRRKIVESFGDWEVAQ